MNDMNNQFKYVIAGVLVLLGVWWIFSDRPNDSPNKLSQQKSDTETQTQVLAEETTNFFPISKAKERVTKKSFGTYITPENSPVSPEKFKGYHTGVDFEILFGEENSDIPVFAICDGPLLQKRTATGFGGVMVQSCNLDHQKVTVVYGHLDLASITKNVKDSIKQGEQIGILGQPPTETDGERKHLHLSVHTGTQIELKGYVPTKAALSAWLDPMRFIK